MIVSLGKTEDIPPGSAKEFSVEQKAIFIINHDGHLHAYENSCPHLGIPLNWQENQFLDHDGELIQCASHGALFTIDSGACVAGPCLGGHLKQYEVNCIDGKITLTL